MQSELKVKWQKRLPKIIGAKTEDNYNFSKVQRDAEWFCPCFILTMSTLIDIHLYKIRPFIWKQETWQWICQYYSRQNNQMPWPQYFKYDYKHLQGEGQHVLSLEPRIKMEVQTCLGFPGRADFSSASWPSTILSVFTCFLPTLNSQSLTIII